MEPEPPIPTDADEETMLCPACLAQNSPDAMFCVKCDAPLSASAVLGPFEQLRAQRFIFHRATTGPSSLFIVIGMWVIFAPVLFVSVLLICDELLYGNLSAKSMLLLIPAILAGGLAVCLLWCVTTNYSRKRLAAAKGRKDEPITPAAPNPGPRR